jgi:hypothetical protein
VPAARCRRRIHSSAKRLCHPDPDRIARWVGRDGQTAPPSAGCCRALPHDPPFAICASHMCPRRPAPLRPPRDRLVRRGVDSLRSTRRHCRSCRKHRTSSARSEPTGAVLSQPSVQASGGRRPCIPKYPSVGTLLMRFDRIRSRTGNPLPRHCPTDTRVRRATASHVLPFDFRQQPVNASSSWVLSQSTLGPGFVPNSRRQQADRRPAKSPDRETSVSAS